MINSDDPRLDDEFLFHIACEMGSYMMRWGRIHVTDMKEKLHTARVYCFLGHTSLHTLLFPRRIMKHPNFPSWLWKLDLYYLGDILTFIARITGFYKYQKFIYRQAYKNAVKWYPHRKDAILNGADYLELLEDLRR